MTKLYFVRHAQSAHAQENERTRPLTEEGLADSQKVCCALFDIKLDYAVSSPYKRSIDTINSCANSHKLHIHTDERLREREKGSDGNNFGMFHKRWSDFDYHEDGGESIHMVQRRNLEAISDILSIHKNKNILIGTHGTALSSILNYYDNTYNCDSFLRMIDYMPYIIRLDFDGKNFICKEELLIVNKEKKGNKRADRK